MERLLAARRPRSVPCSSRSRAQIWHSLLGSFAAAVLLLMSFSRHMADDYTFAVLTGEQLESDTVILGSGSRGRYLQVTYCKLRMVSMCMYSCYMYNGMVSSTYRIHPQYSVFVFVDKDVLGRYMHVKGVGRECGGFRMVSRQKVRALGMLVLRKAGALDDKTADLSRHRSWFGPCFHGFPS